MIKRIFFDLGLTLVEHDAPARYAELLSGLGRPTREEEARRAYHLANKYFMREEPGRLGKGNAETLRAFLSQVCRELDVPELELPLWEGVLQGPRPPEWRCFPFTVETLTRLREGGYALGLISNWDASCREVLRRNGLDKLLDPIVVSWEAGVEKPDRRIFEHALSLCGEAPEECLYVGDNYYDDGVGAASVGMECCILNPPGLLGIEELRLPWVETDLRGVERTLRRHGGSPSGAALKQAGRTA